MKRHVKSNLTEKQWHLIVISMDMFKIDINVRYFMEFVLHVSW